MTDQHTGTGPHRLVVTQLALSAADHLARITAALSRPTVSGSDTGGVLVEMAALTTLVGALVGEYGRQVVDEHTPGWPQHDQRATRPSYTGARNVPGLRMYQAADHTQQASDDLAAAAGNLAAAAALATAANDQPPTTSPSAGPAQRVRTSGLTGSRYVDPDPTFGGTA